MSDLTLYLGVAAIALFFITVIVSLFLPKKQSLSLLKQGVTKAMPEWQEERIFSGQELLPEEKIPLIEGRMNAINKKVLLAHERLQKIEETLQKSAGQNNRLLAAPATEIKALDKRVDRLMDFKSNAEIDLAAIKDALREKGILKPAAAPKAPLQKKTSSPENPFQGSEKRLHDIIYRAASSK